MAARARHCDSGSTTAGEANSSAVRGGRDDVCCVRDEEGRTGGGCWPRPHTGTSVDVATYSAMTSVQRPKTGTIKWPMTPPTPPGVVELLLLEAGGTVAHSIRGPDRPSAARTDSIAELSTQTLNSCHRAAHRPEGFGPAEGVPAVPASHCSYEINPTAAPPPPPTARLTSYGIVARSTTTINPVVVTDDVAAGGVAWWVSLDATAAVLDDDGKCCDANRVSAIRHGSWTEAALVGVGPAWGMTANGTVGTPGARAVGAPPGVRRKEAASDAEGATTADV